MGAVSDTHESCLGNLVIVEVTTYLSEGVAGVKLGATEESEFEDMCCHAGNVWTRISPLYTTKYLILIIKAQSSA